MKVITLKSGREKSALSRHPWVFSGAVQFAEENIQPGESVLVYDSKGTVLGSAAFSSSSSIRARFWNFSGEVVDRNFIENRIRSAISARGTLGLDGVTNGVRLIHGESDGVPGLVVDRYANVVSVQILSAGAEFWREDIIQILSDLPGVEAVVERSDADVRSLEGLESRTGVVYGRLPDQLTIQEHGINYLVDVLHGQKTGFYLDQRQNRKLVVDHAAGNSVLNCFCYTGGFGIAALKGGAKSLASLDSSAEAIELAKQNMQLNDLDPDDSEWILGDAFVQLRRLRDMNRKFDLIVMDPPKFAPTASQAQKAARGYKDINLLALKMLNPGGLLFTFSCSGGITAEFFRTILFEAALDAKVDAQILHQMHQDADHPISLNFPEGEYLKGYLIRV